MAKTGFIVGAVALQNKAEAREYSKFIYGWWCYRAKQRPENIADYLVRFSRLLEARLG